MIDMAKKFLSSPAGLVATGAAAGIAGLKAGEKAARVCKKNGWLWYDAPEKKKSKNKSKNKNNKKK